VNDFPGCSFGHTWRASSDSNDNIQLRVELGKMIVFGLSGLGEVSFCDVHSLKPSGITGPKCTTSSGADGKIRPEVIVCEHKVQV